MYGKTAGRLLLPGSALLLTLLLALTAACGGEQAPTAVPAEREVPPTADSGDTSAPAPGTTETPAAPGTEEPGSGGDQQAPATRPASAPHAPDTPPTEPVYPDPAPTDTPAVNGEDEKPTGIPSPWPTPPAEPSGTGDNPKHKPDTVTPTPTPVPEGGEPPPVSEQKHSGAEALEYSGSGEAPPAVAYAGEHPEVVMEAGAAGSGGGIYPDHPRGPRGPGWPPGPRGNRPGSPPLAGETDDNAGWRDYLRFLMEYHGGQQPGPGDMERYVITLTGEDCLPVRGAAILIELPDGTDVAQVRTHADGRAVYHHQPGGPGEDTQELVFTALQKGQYLTHADVARSKEGGEVRLNAPEQPRSQDPLKLDILFLLDSTGSMSDEINRIKSTLVSISERVAGLPDSPDLRMAMVVYRDRGDAYLNRLYGFDHDARRFAQTVSRVRAEGGGDYPEALSEALQVAVNEPAWRPDAAKLIFLIGDAPPQDYGNQIHYTADTRLAQEKGIKIFAVASSGLDRRGEFVFRHIAQRTMGHFIFLLYQDHPGAPLETPHDVGEQYTVEDLDSLIVRLIAKELLSGSEQPGAASGNGQCAP